MPRPRLRRWLLAALALVLVVLVALFARWRENTRNGGQHPAEPFRIAGNLYYVGTNDISAFLLTGPAGHVLLDGGYPGTAPMIEASIRRLGFDVRDVRLLLNSEPHYDHAGGLAELQRASGARLAASAPSADALEAGGVDPDLPWYARAFLFALTRYEAPRVDRRLADGDTVRVGPMWLVAHVTGGHTRGCTTWSFPVHEGGRTLHVVSACSLAMLGMARYPGQDADIARTFGVLRALPADVWVTSHARPWGRWRKYAARDTARSPVAPFIDPAGYRAYVDSGEARWRRGVRQ